MRESGAQRLKKEREEAYAQERAFGYRRCEAARRVGLKDRSGIATRYENKPRIQARIAFLRKDDLTAEMREAKRRHLEERLEAVAFGNLFEFTKIDGNNPTIDWQALSESDLAVIVSEFRFDKDTGKLVHFQRDSALQAIAQLREMRGFKAAEKRDLTIHSVDQMSDDELLRIAASGQGNEEHANG